MHIQTHIMTGWCLANVLPLNARQRGLAILASTLPDLDGISIFFGQAAYETYHHKICHNFAFALLLCAVLAYFAGNRIKAFIVFLAIFHIHLVMDLFGSGIGWGISYLWPFSDHYFYTDYVWEFFSWQNKLAAGIAFLWCILIAVYACRTPLETFMPNLDRQLVQLAQKLRIGKIKNKSEKMITVDSTK